MRGSTRASRRPSEWASFGAPATFGSSPVSSGAYEEFLYVDADIVVFEPILDLLDELGASDFVCFDDQHEGGLIHVFDEAVRAERVFDPEQLADVFNAGFWGRAEEASRRRRSWSALPNARRTVTGWIWCTEGRTREF